MFNALQVASLFATLDLRDNATQGLRSFDNSLSRTGDRISRFGAGMRNVGLSITAATAPLVAFGVQGVQTAANFEMAMATIQARTGLTDEAMDEMRRMALRLGADTAFSAQQAADAMLELLSSGNSAQEVLAMLPAVLDAAAASGADLGQTADDVTNILSTFSLDAEQAVYVVDSLARASGSSSATMAQLGEAFANVGDRAARYGLDVAETAAILAIFAERGIKGAEAGTQLSSMLQNMDRRTEDVNEAWRELGVSLYDADGNIRDLNIVFAELHEAMSDLPAQEQNRLMQQLFGTYGVGGGAALIAAAGMSTMSAAMEEAAAPDGYIFRRCGLASGFD
jgi:TP901 family phage tail tape measure protein